MFTFAGCRLDVAGRTLVRAGEPQHLEPQAFDVLVHLVAHRDRVVRWLAELDCDQTIDLDP